jgi:hypothetical protein
MNITEFANPQEFQRFCSLLFSAEYPDFQSIDDSGGDLGIDGYISGRIIFMIYCPEKPQKNTDSNKKTKILKDVKKASNTIRAGKMAVDTLVFVTPMNLRANVIIYLEDQCKKYNLKGISFGEDKLTELAAKHYHIAKQFPFLILPDISGQLEQMNDKLSSIQRTLHPKSKKDDKIQKSIFDKEQRLKEANQILNGGNIDKFMKISREIYYETIDDEVKLQAIINIVFNSILNEQNSELISMSEEGIALAEKLNSLEMQALLMAQKARLLRIDIDWLTISMWYEKQVAERIGIFDANKYNSQLNQAKKKGQEIETLLENSIEIAHSNKLYWALAEIYLIVGIMTSNTYATVSRTRPDLSGFYDNRCKLSLSEAKRIYSALGYEEGVLNAKHNLANHLRFTGEVELSKKYTKEVLEEAKTNGFGVLEIKATELLYSIENMSSKDYECTPEEFLQKMKERRKKVMENKK